ncbi:sporulation membrane protein YtrI [Bacillus massilinigeriensis]|uniref:sporulation membrane protein YtrI n=1 Tax=Bacillus mediterraneensis TaxID=1805474 RepID=UPI0008F89EC2|nr:sporulation membrane protein YtrI [Bacillus mediterraneensis]
MRIPPYYRLPSWKRFFSGMAIGGVVSWMIFLYIHGVWMEEKSKKITEQAETIEKLQSGLKIYQEDDRKLNEKNIEALKIQEINVRILNYEKYELDSFGVFESEEEIKDDLSMFIAKDLDFVYKSRDMIRKMIENKVIKLNGKRYRLEIKSMLFFTTVNVLVDIHLEE